MAQESNASPHAQHHHTAPSPPPSSWGVIYPEGDVVAVLDDCATADRTVRDLEAAGVPPDDIFLIEGQRAVQIEADFRQHQHTLGRIGRAISNLLSDAARFDRQYLEEARQGHHLLVVQAPTDQVVARIRPILRSHGAHLARRYGALVVEDLP